MLCIKYCIMYIVIFQTDVNQYVTIREDYDCQNGYIW